MPRTARRKSETGIYHIFLRGINRQTIFLDEEDNNKFLQTIAECKKISGFRLLGYCLMGNHVHLLLQEEREGIELIFRRVGARYVYWYNRKYERVGHLFQDRFKSEPVEDDKYLLTVLRYIHRNPLKAGLCKSLKDYKWSSYNDYIDPQGITDVDFMLNIMGLDEFIKYTDQANDDERLDVKDRPKRLTDEALSKIICQRCKIQPTMIQNETKEKKVALLKEILDLEGVTTRQLSRVTGVSINTIWTLKSK